MEYSMMLFLMGACALIILVLIGPAIGNQLEDALLQIDVSKSHGVQRHGSQAIAVRICHDQFGADHVFYHEEWDRTACIIEFEENDKSRWGVRVLDKVKGKDVEVTAFIQKQGKTWSEFVEYMVSKGYELVH